MTVEAELEIENLTTLKAASAELSSTGESVAAMVLKGTQALALAQFETAAEVFEANARFSR
jgi:hypothetical protein